VLVRLAAEEPDQAAGPAWHCSRGSRAERGGGLWSSVVFAVSMLHGSSRALAVWADPLAAVRWGAACLASRGKCSLRPWTDKAAGAEPVLALAPVACERDSAVPGAGEVGLVEGLEVGWRDRWRFAALSCMYLYRGGRSPRQVQPAWLGAWLGPHRKRSSEMTRAGLRPPPRRTMRLSSAQPQLRG